MNFTRCLTALAVTLVAAPAAAQESPQEAEASETLVAVPDRPTFSTAPYAVPAGHAQLEGGVEFNSSADRSALAIPVLVRFGVADSFELRAGLPAPNIGLGADSDSHLGGLQIGGKVAGALNETLSLGVMPFFNIASESGDSTVFSQSDFGTFFLWGLGFGDFGLSGNLGISVGPGATAESGPREFFYAASLAAAYTLGDFGVTAEGFTEVGQVADADVGAQLALGYALADTLVVDLYGGAGLAGALPDFWVGLGATFAK